MRRIHTPFLVLDEVSVVPPFIESMEEIMNWDRIEGNWKQLKGKVKEKWGKLTDEDLTVVEGKRDQLVGKLQERYGMAKEDAERELQTFSDKVNT
jgi:uncharacterized protein YjbJ (UPF0337 family)